MRVCSVNRDPQLVLTPGSLPILLLYKSPLIQELCISLLFFVIKFKSLSTICCTGGKIEKGFIVIIIVHYVNVHIMLVDMYVNQERLTFLSPVYSVNFAIHLS